MVPTRTLFTAAAIDMAEIGRSFVPRLRLEIIHTFRDRRATVNGTLDAIYLSFRSRLARTVSRIVPPKDVEDIVQETYVRLCQVENPADIRHPRSYLLTTARNLALDHVKRAESRLSDTLDDDGPLSISVRDPLADETFAGAAANEEFALFCDAVRRLPIQCRRVFVLKKVYGYSQREIAQELGVSENTVEKHIALGVKRCTYFMMRHASIADDIRDSAPTKDRS